MISYKNTPSSSSKINLHVLDNIYLNQNKEDKLNFPLDANNNKIINLAQPNDDNDVVNKTFVESLFIKKGEIIDMQNKTITNLKDCENDSEASNKRYVDTLLSSKINKQYVDENFFKKDLDINLNFKKIINCATPITNGDLINKKYIDDLFKNTLGNFKFHDEIINFGPDLTHQTINPIVIKDLVSVKNSISLLVGFIAKNKNWIDVKLIKEVKLYVDYDAKVNKNNVLLEFPGGYVSLSNLEYSFMIKLIYFTF